MFTEFAGAAIISVMSVAGVLAHRRNGFFVFKGRLRIRAGAGRSGAGGGRGRSGSGVDRPRLHDKVAVITGAGSGIGKAIAHRFAAEEARVVGAGISGSAERVAAEIGGGAPGIKADVSDEDDVRRLIVTAEDAFGRIDILVDNTGFGGGSIVNISSTAATRSASRGWAPNIRATRPTESVPPHEAR